MLDTTAYILFIGFGLYGARQSYREIKHAHASRSWPHTNGVIITSTTQVEKDEDGTSEKAFILYFYEVNGIPYRSARIFFGDALAGRTKDVIRWCRATYPPGKAVKVYYDPAAPHRALLKTGPTRAAYFAFLFPAGLSLWGLVALLARLVH